MDTYGFIEKVYRRIKMKKKTKKILIATLSVVALTGITYAICTHSAMKELREELMNDIKNMEEE